MAEPYIGEIRMFAGNFAPLNWAFCEGQLIPISENDTLYTLIGTTYGGDGMSTFALPDLRGRIPIHMGNGYGSNFTLGEKDGTEQVTLTVQQIPIHTHPVRAQSGPGDTNSPENAVWAKSNFYQFSDQTDHLVSMSPQEVSGAGGSQPHDNMMPYLCVNFIISLYGIFPSQS